MGSAPLVRKVHNLSVLFTSEQGAYLEGAINMSDLDNELDETNEGSQPLDPNIRRQLREADKARKELESARAELEKQKLELQFTKAGIPETGAGALLRKAYDGDSSVEAIRKAAEEYGILTPQQKSNPAVDGELDALRRAQGATIGTSGAGPDLGQEFLARIQEATSPEEAMKIVAESQYEKLGVWTSRNVC